MAALAQLALEITRVRITASVATRPAAGTVLGGRRQAYTDSWIRNALGLIDSGEPATVWPVTGGCPRRRCTGGSESSPPW